MIEKGKKYQEEKQKIEAELQSPEILSDPKKMAELSRKLSEVREITDEFDKLAKIQHGIEEAKELIRMDESFAADAEAEITRLEEEKTEQEKRIEEALLPKDPNDNKNIIMEIRAGAGGDEASLFAAELFRMYSRYAEKHKMKLETMDTSFTEGGGIKEVVAEIKGQGAYGTFKFESGVHRVQRVPETESQGRVHTSTATVAVLPEAEEVDIEIKQSEVRVDVFRSSGPGGQSVNTTDSAVRLTHLPTGLVVTCQDEKSQLKNKDKAMKILRSRLLAAKEEEEAKKRGDARKNQIGSGDRSEKIRTYNFPQDRITDHRIGFSTSNIPGFMNGDIDPMIAKLKEAEREELLKQAE